MRKKILALFVCIFLILPLSVPLSFAEYTVDFHYNDMVYNLKGGSEIYLSELFSVFNYTEHNILDVINVSFSDETLIKIEKQNNDWLLTSLKAFNTEEYLEVKFNDGQSLIIQVTDVNLHIFTDRTDINAFWSLTSSAFHHITVSLYNEAGNFIASDKCTSVLSSGWLHMSSQYYWFEVMNSQKCGTLNYSAAPTSSKNTVTLGALPDAVLLWCSNKNEHNINVKMHSHTIYDNTNPYCTINQTSEFVLSGDTELRYVKIYIDNVEVTNYTGYNSTFLFPDRDEASTHEDKLYASDLNVSAKSGYEYIKTETDNANKTYRVYLNTKTYSATANAGTGISKTTGSGTYKYNSSVTFGAVNNTGYTFDGWYNGTTKISNNINYTFTMPNNAVSYTAKANPNSYYVSFNGNGNTSGSMSNQKFTYDTAQNLNENTYKREYTVNYNTNGGTVDIINDVAKSTFNGWSTSATAEKTYNDKQNIINLTSVNGSTINLYANWNLGSVKLPTPTREGYVFDGWYTTQNIKIGNGNDNYIPTSNITVYAHWTESSNTITYKAGDGGTTSVTSETINAITGEVQGSTAISNEGYKFDGWYSDENYTNKISDDNFLKPTNSTSTYYAKFSKITYEIKFDTMGGHDSLETLIKIDGVDITLPDTIPVRENYTFIGWTTSMNENAKIYLPGDVYSENGNVTLYAKWVKNAETADLTISRTISKKENVNQVSVFTITGVKGTNTENFIMTVSLCESNTLTIHDLPIGQYVITEDNNWSWQYEIDDVSQTINVQENQTNTVEFNNTYKTNIYWLTNCNIPKKNIYGTKIGTVKKDGEK